MKFRNGFVSNSSSSSFIIGVKNNTLERALEQVKIKNHPFSDIIDEMVDTILENSGKITFKELVEDMGFDTIEEYVEEYGDGVLKLNENGFQLYRGSFSSEGETGAEIMLCYSNLNYKSDNLVFMHEGGY